MHVASIPHVTPQRAPKNEYVPLLHELLDRCRRWDDARIVGRRSLHAPERALILRELEQLVELTPARGSLWRGMRRLVSRRRGDVRTAERALLQTFERVCERPLPLHVSSVLLRHYGALRRAAQKSESGSSGPPAPPPREPRARFDLEAVAH